MYAESLYCAGYHYKILGDGTRILYGVIHDFAIRATVRSSEFTERCVYILLPSYSKKSYGGLETGSFNWGSYGRLIKKQYHHSKLRGTRGVIQNEYEGRKERLYRREWVALLVFSFILDYLHAKYVVCCLYAILSI